MYLLDVYMKEMLHKQVSRISQFMRKFFLVVYKR